MSAITRFAAQDPGPAARLAGFMAHLRAHGLNVGVGETATALAALTQIEAIDPNQARMALKSVCVGCSDEAARFDALFDSYWRSNGRVRQKIIPSTRISHSQHSRGSEIIDGPKSANKGTIHSPDNTSSDGESHSDGTGKLMATSVKNLMKKDLRDLVSPHDIAAAEQVALRLAAAFTDRRSRRNKAAQRGEKIDFRRTLRASLATGGVPFKLARRKRPDRHMRLVALCDVSGSMAVYARIYLAFLAGLMRCDRTADAYLFHTGLVRITQALRDPDPLRALNRLTLLADGFGGGSKIGATLAQFSQTYARRFVNGRSVVIILSDGYDTDPPEGLANALIQLKKRGCKVIWLNPLKGWQGYEPIACAMAQALPHLDLFAAATTLNDLAALEKQVTRL